MAEKLTVYQPGERLATISDDGLARVWRVLDNGLLVRSDLWVGDEEELDGRR